MVRVLTIFAPLPYTEDNKRIAPETRATAQCE
jgi:hypothetical protein